MPENRRDDVPRWVSEDPVHYLIYKRAVQKWVRADQGNKEQQVDRLALHFRSRGILDLTVEGMDRERITWKNADHSGQDWAPRDAHGNLDPHRAFQTYIRVPRRARRARIPSREEGDPGVASEDSVPSHDEGVDPPIKFTTGVDYMLEVFSAKFEKSERNTFTRRFNRLFNLRRRNRHVQEWLTEFDTARAELEMDPIGHGLFNLPDFVWANWILETAEISGPLRIILETRIPDWRTLTVDIVKTQLRDMLQGPERQLQGKGERPGYTAWSDEGFGGTDSSGSGSTYTALPQRQGEQLVYRHNEFHDAWVEYDRSTGLFTNSGSPDDPAVYSFWAESEQVGATFSCWGTLDKGQTWFQAEDETPDIQITYQDFEPELDHDSAVSGFWEMDPHTGGVYCLAVYPKGKARTGARHPKEGDGKGQKNQDGLTCHRCGGDTHFTNNCSRPAPRKGKGKGRRKGGSPFRPPPRTSKGKGKGFMRSMMGYTEDMVEDDSWDSQSEYSGSEYDGGDEGEDTFFGGKGRRGGARRKGTKKGSRRPGSRQWGQRGRGGKGLGFLAEEYPAEYHEQGQASYATQYASAWTALPVGSQPTGRTTPAHASFGDTPQITSFSQPGN